MELDDGRNQVDVNSVAEKLFLKSVAEMSDQSQVMEDKVLAWLSQQTAVILEQVYDIIPLEIPEELKGKKIKLLNKLLNHLCGLEDVVDGDKGLSVYLLINDEIEKGVNKDETKVLPGIKTEIKSVTEQLSNPDLLVKRDNPRVDVVKLRDFKISGVIGGKNDSLSYTSLLYQIDCGRRLGYTDVTICDAVIRAISPSNHLRTYLEGQKTVSVDCLLEILQSICIEKDSNSLLLELGNAVQQIHETCVEYIVRLMSMRDRILTYSKEENSPVEEPVMRTKFFHTMFTGMRNPNVRAELRELCKGNSKIPDQTLLKFAAEASKNESERNEKLSSAKNAAHLSEISKENDIKIKEKKEKLNPFTQIDEVKLLHAQEIASLRADIFELKNVLSSATGKSASQNESDVNFSRQNTDAFRNHAQTPNFRGRGISNFNTFRGQNRGWKNRCEQCRNSNVQRCNHCFKCGEEGHRSFNCNAQIDNATKNE